LEISFWGVRGSVACCSPAYDVVGGHTSCVSVQINEQMIIFDAGTGIRDLGTFIESKNIQSAILCLSHAHYDHVIGFPFFSPIWNEDFALTVIAGTLHRYKGVREFFSKYLFSHPFFPISIPQLAAKFNFVDLPSGEIISFYEGVILKTFLLNHPGGAMGYRLEANGKSLCYITDHEHSDPIIHTQLTEFIREADLLIYDATFTDEEYPRHIGWGHSTWQEGIKLAKAAGIKNLALFHHEPTHTDEIMAQIEEKARALWPGVFIAKQGMKVRIA
jgi:phosphoribosyl 1,2-cyclic phosphodiesterase